MKSVIFDIISLIILGLFFQSEIARWFPILSLRGGDGSVLLTPSVMAISFWAGIATFVSWKFDNRRYRSLGRLLFSDNLSVDDQKPIHFWKWQLLLLLSFLFYYSVQVTEASFGALLDWDGFQGVLRLVGGLVQPNWEILPLAIGNIITTVYMAFLATALAIPIAFSLSFLASKNIMKSPLEFGIYTVLRTLFNLVRSIEALIWAIIFSVWVGIGPFAGMLALMVHSVASLAKQYSEIIEGVSEGPIEGILSTGAKRVAVIWYAIVPQVILPFISFTIYRWDINIRMATIVGLVGGGGIGTMFIQYSGQAMWPEVGTIILVIAVVVWLMDAASAHIREALK